MEAWWGAGGGQTRQMAMPRLQLSWRNTWRLEAYPYKPLAAIGTAESSGRDWRAVIARELQIDTLATRLPDQHSHQLDGVLAVVV